jgi:hypothetical protein
MKINRALFAPVALSLLAAIAAGVVWHGSTPAYAAVTWNTKLVPIKGSVDGVPETVVFSGNAKVNSRLAPDPVFNTPTLVLAIDLSGISAVGSSTRSKYVVSGPEMVQRKVAASQLVEITFPFAKGSMGGTSEARTGVATFALNFDLTSGAVTTGTGNVSSPNFPR